jgi:hypothetical protein
MTNLVLPEFDRNKKMILIPHLFSQDQVDMTLFSVETFYARSKWNQTSKRIR